MKTLFYLGLSFFCFSVLVQPNGGLVEKDEKEPAKQPLKVLLKKWEKEVQEKCANNPELKKLKGTYPLVILVSSHHFPKARSLATYSFIHATSDQEINRNNVQLRFVNDGFYPSDLEWNMVVGQQNLVVDLEKWDFEKDPDISSFSIDHPQVFTASCKAQKRHVYLERIRDNRGNDFCVLFKVVALDPQGRYMAFIWRKLPGGKVAEQP